MDLRDKVAVVTGASSGIGEAIARQLSKSGAKLVLTARRADRLAALADQLGTACACHAVSIDAPGAAQALLDLGMERFGRADILINNAGVFTAGPLETIELDEISRMISINFDAVVRTSYLFARHFKVQKSGAIVNISSIGAYLTSPGVGVYGGLKHALEVFTSALRVELSGTGVKVGTVAPGTTQTEIFDHLRARGQEVRADRTPPLEPADIADAVHYMLTQPDRANVARMLVVSSAESA